MTKQGSGTLKRQVLVLQVPEPGTGSTSSCAHCSDVSDGFQINSLLYVFSTFV
jgi:hypothetical protein